MTTINELNVLKKYLFTHRIKQADFAKTVMCSKSYLEQILANLRIPGTGLALRIELATKGEIPMSYWNSTRQTTGKKRARRKHSRVEAS